MSENIVIHTYPKIICYLFEIQSILCFYFPNMATLVKTEYRKYMDYLYLAEKRLYFNLSYWFMQIF